MRRKAKGTGGSSTGVAIGDPVIGATPNLFLYVDNAGDLYQDSLAERDSVTLESKILRNFDSEIITATSSFTGTGTNDLNLNNYNPSTAVGKTYTVTIDSALNFSGYTGTLPSSAYTIGGTYSSSNVSAKCSVNVNGDYYVDITGYTGGTITPVGGSEISSNSGAGNYGYFISEGSGTIRIGGVQSSPIQLNVGDVITDSQNNILFTVDAGMTISSPVINDIVTIGNSNVTLSGGSLIYEDEFSYIVDGTAQSLNYGGLDITFASLTGNLGNVVDMAYVYGAYIANLTSTSGTINNGDTFTQATSGATGVVLNIDYVQGTLYLTQITGVIDYNEDLIVAGGTITLDTNINKPNDIYADTYSITDGTTTTQFNPIADTNPFQFDSGAITLNFSGLLGHYIGDYWTYTFASVTSPVETGFITRDDISIKSIPVPLKGSIINAVADDVQSLAGIINTQPFGNTESSSSLIGKFYDDGSRNLMSFDTKTQSSIYLQDNTTNKSVSTSYDNSASTITNFINDGLGNGQDEILTATDYTLTAYPNTRDDLSAMATYVLGATTSPSSYLGGGSTNKITLTGSYTGSSLDTFDAYIADGIYGDTPSCTSTNNNINFGSPNDITFTGNYIGSNGYLGTKYILTIEPGGVTVSIDKQDVTDLSGNTVTTNLGTGLSVGSIYLATEGITVNFGSSSYISGEQWESSVNFSTGTQIGEAAMFIAKNNSIIWNGGSYGVPFFVPVGTGSGTYSVLISDGVSADVTDAITLSKNSAQAQVITVVPTPPNVLYTDSNGKFQSAPFPVPPAPTVTGVTNGISLIGTDVALGGSLTQYTTIDINDQQMAFSGSDTAGNGVSVYFINGETYFSNYTANGNSYLDQYGNYSELAVKDPTSSIITRLTQTDTNLELVAGDNNPGLQIGYYASSSSDINFGESARIVTPNVRNATAVNGQILTLVDNTNGNVEFTSRGGSIRTVTSTDSFSSTDVTIHADTTGGAFNITLPDATTAIIDFDYNVKIIAGANNVTVFPVSGTIDGAPSFTITNPTGKQSVSFYTDGTDYFVR